MLERFIALNGLVFDIGSAVLANALNAVAAGVLTGIDLADRDDFTVVCLQVELESGFDFSDDEFSHGWFLL